MDLRQKLVILILGITNTSLYPCSCDTIPFDYAVDSADEIFVGEIVGAEMFQDGEFTNLENKKDIIWNGFVA